LKRTFHAKTDKGKQVSVEAIRFCSIADDETGAISYTITPLNFTGSITITPFVDGDVVNKDSNYDEKFWDEVKKATWDDGAFVQLRTKKTGFEVATGMKVVIEQNSQPVKLNGQPIEKEKYVGLKTELKAVQGQSITIYKYAANLSSRNYDAAALEKNLK